LSHLQNARTQCGKAQKNKYQKNAPVKIKSENMLIIFYDSDGIIHKKFVPQYKIINEDYYWTL